jgi:hypothetical protein
MYERYEQLALQIEALEVEKEALRIAIADDMQKNGIKKQESEYGTFSMSKRTTWTFPPAVVKMKEDLKAAEEMAKSTNEAKAEETYSLRYTPKSL